jgi:hypothetical protein
VWEIGGLGRQGVFVNAEQPTGRMITFPSKEVLTGGTVNFIRDFPFVWDERTIPIDNESELGYAMEVLRGVAEEILGEGMAERAEAYEAIRRTTVGSLRRTPPPGPGHRNGREAWGGAGAFLRPAPHRLHALAARAPGPGEPVGWS